MMEDELVSDFNICLDDIANNSFYLGEKMLEEKMVRNIRIYLPQKFNMKVIAVEEA